MYQTSMNQKSMIDTVSKTKYVIISLLPMYLAVIIGIVYPKLIRKIFFLFIAFYLVFHYFSFIRKYFNLRIIWYLWIIDL